MVSDIRNKLIGSWRLVSAVREPVASGARTEVFGPGATGWIMYTADGRMSALITAANRTQPTTDADHAALHKSMLGYAGSFDVRGNDVLHHIDVAWQPAIVGSTFVRHVAFEADRLVLTSPPGPSAVDGVVAVVTIVWERARHT